MTDQTSATIIIDALPEPIMAVIEDFPAYPEWVASMRQAEILTTSDGRPETVRMALEHPLLRDTYVLGYDWEPREVRWHLVEGSMLTRMDGSYVLTAAGAQTSVTYTLVVDIAVPMIGMIKRKAERTIVDGALAGLKRRVER